MFKFLAAMIGLGGIVAAAPAQASVGEQPDLSPHAHSIEALEDFLWRNPGAKAAVLIELAKFECAAGQQWRCGADGRSEPGHRGYGG